MKNSIKTYNKLVNDSLVRIETFTGKDTVMAYFNTLKDRFVSEGSQKPMSEYIQEGTLNYYMGILNTDGKDIQITPLMGFANDEQEMLNNVLSKCEELENWETCALIRDVSKSN